MMWTAEAKGRATKRRVTWANPKSHVAAAPVPKTTGSNSATRANTAMVKAPIHRLRVVIKPNV